jgi:hypothetical protein
VVFIGDIEGPVPKETCPQILLVIVVVIGDIEGPVPREISPGRYRGACPQGDEGPVPKETRY